MKSLVAKIAGAVIITVAMVGCNNENDEQPMGPRYAFVDEQTVIDVTPQTESFDLECLYLWPINEESMYIQLPMISVDASLSTAVEGEDFIFDKYSDNITLTGHKIRIPVQIIAGRITDEVKIVFVIDEIADRDLPSHTTVILRPASE